MINLGECALLSVCAIEEMGAFLDQGSEKDLFLPFSEQTRDLKVGDQVLICVYSDKLGRPTASMRIEKRLLSPPLQFQENEGVDLIIYTQTDLGYKAIINKKFLGMLYQNEVFQPLAFGQKLPGFIKRIRPDGKIDLALQLSGYRGIDQFAETILNRLRKDGGFLPVTDKSPPELISELFGMSKKKYKMTIGTLLKENQISLDEKGIHLFKKKST